MEPNPEFYMRMLLLARRTAEALQTNGTYDTDYLEPAESIRAYITMLKNLKAKSYLEFREEDKSFLGSEAKLLNQARTIVDWNKPSTINDDSPDYVPELIAWLETLLKDIESGNIDKHPEIKERVESSFFMHGEIDFWKDLLPSKWKDLEQICWQLTHLAHKQLRQVPLDRMDNEFIQDYGKKIADLMFYDIDGSQYLIPRDDAPRIINVYSHTDVSSQHLHVGVARARELIVLYPWQGKTYLCRGAVMTYYEFSSPTLLNDAEWKSLLDSDKRPAIPRWFAPIVEGGKLDPPKMRD